MTGVVLAAWRHETNRLPPQRPFASPGAGRVACDSCSSASGSALLGLDGFQLVSAGLVGGEWQLAVQSVATVIGCQGCGMRAKLDGRRTVRVRDLPIGGRPVVLLRHKRIWRCGEPACEMRTWTERAAAIRLGRC
jgi:zinc-finger of transposase IS204/IS1001/IS1096/IS1165